MTFHQIHKLYFKEKSISTAYSRISQLSRGGFITSVKIGDILDSGGSISCIYQITRKTIDILLKQFPEKIFSSYPVKLNLSCLYHDYLLTECLSVLRTTFEQKEFKNSKVYPLKSSKNEKQPDAYIYDHNGHLEGAIEVELTRKSDRRYQEIITNYRLNNDYPSVVYLTLNERIKCAIKEIICGREVPGLGQSSSEKFYFAKTNDIILKPKNVIISNGKEQLFNPGQQMSRKEMAL